MEVIDPPPKSSASDFERLEAINPYNTYVLKQISLLRKNINDIGFHYQ